MFRLINVTTINLIKIINTKVKLIILILVGDVKIVSIVIFTLDTTFKNAK